MAEREIRELRRARVDRGECIDCGTKLGESEAKVFTCCDGCWAIAYRSPKVAPPLAARSPAPALDALFDPRVRRVPIADVLAERLSADWSEPIQIKIHHEEPAGDVVLLCRTLYAPDAPPVWIVGRDSEWDWEIQGIYLTEGDAAARCEDASWFIGPVRIGQTVPTATTTWEGARRPREEIPA